MHQDQALNQGEWLCRVPLKCQVQPALAGCL